MTDLFAHMRVRVLDALHADPARPAGRRRCAGGGYPARATPHMATWRPTPRWSRPRSRAASRRSSPRALAEALRDVPEIAEAAAAGPGFVNLRLRPEALRAVLPAILRAGDCLRRRHERGGPAGQRRIRLGQPDRADAYRPLPRRRGGRCAGQPARQGRLRGDQGILHQRRRHAGHRARLGRLLALPAGDRHAAVGGGIRRRGARRAAIPRRLPGPGRRRTCRRARRARSQPRRAGSPRRNAGSISCATSPSPR